MCGMVKHRETRSPQGCGETGSRSLRQHSLRQHHHNSYETLLKGEFWRDLVHNNTNKYRDSFGPVKTACFFTCSAS